MSSWTEGYITEIDYTHGYYRELSPTLQRFALVLAGYAPPPEDGDYLELGYGQGLATAIHAAATPNRIWGTDFNSSQAANARSLAEAAGVDVYLFDDSFAELDARTDLPEFQYLGLHGIWSWISNENRNHIVSIMRRRLAVGGVAYISYNCLPGWSATLSLRHLLNLHAETAGAETQGVAGRVDAAVAFAQQLVDKGALFFRANPLVAERLKSISGQNRRYVAHEYFNREWDPMPFSNLVEWLSPAKLDFAGSVHVLDQMDVANLNAEGREVIRNITHVVLRESVRDYFINQQFRRDLFMRGPRTLTGLERQEALLAMGFTLLAKVEDIPLKLNAPVGEMALSETVYRPLLDAMARNSYRPHSLAELQKELPDLPFPQILEAMMVLVGANYAHPVQSDRAMAKAKPRTAALNAELCRRARSSGDVSQLASPIIGAGVPISQFQQLFLAARAEGKKTPEDWARAVWQVVVAQGQALIKDGKQLTTPEENLTELTQQATDFADKRLPILKALGVAA